MAETPLDIVGIGNAIVDALKEFGVEHGAEAGVIRAVGELDSDYATGSLAEPTTVLPLYTGGTLAGFRMAGVVEDADGRDRCARCLSESCDSERKVEAGATRFFC